MLRWFCSTNFPGLQHVIQEGSLASIHSSQQEGEQGKGAFRGPPGRCTHQSAHTPLSRACSMATPGAREAGQYSSSERPLAAPLLQEKGRCCWGEQESPPQMETEELTGLLGRPGTGLRKLVETKGGHGAGPTAWSR